MRVWVHSWTWRQRWPRVTTELEGSKGLLSELFLSDCLKGGLVSAFRCADSRVSTWQTEKGPQKKEP